MPLPRMVDLARAMVVSVLAPGDHVIDATVGNGRDTLWLAQQVGPSGRVLGLDLQRDALQRTQGRLIAAGVEDRVMLVRCGHEQLDAMLPEHGLMARPKVVMFNLGYLPGGDPTVVTRAETSLTAVSCALRRVVSGGLVTVILYPGHPEGHLESELILSWAKELNEHHASMIRCEVVSKTRTPAPWLLAISPAVDQASGRRSVAEPGRL